LPLLRRGGGRQVTLSASAPRTLSPPTEYLAALLAVRVGRERVDRLGEAGQQPKDRPHCAAFNATVFPKIKSEYIDTGKIRYIFREFPLDIKAAAGSMLSRCIAKDDGAKYLAVTDMLFRQQSDWVMKDTAASLSRIGKQAGLSQQQVDDCLKDQSLLDKIAADQKYAAEVLKVDSTPTFFVDGRPFVGARTFETFQEVIDYTLAAKR